ncbi:hypothetical protein [Cerasicoccus arenae]|uniref:Uncharacterized protein n=1 Tax=Cerasicoccus arenae TaxID=424488 RepID=A0A8J3DBW1_9BACT|nr:hypothetical protein [Cerasicoccus arenae]MBK1859240.1 hypothetical protein [Cerasicoccus arenae]GHC02798.1 hypothetical protein GCM10007047_19350 [Cerasicoccus arenae]
MAHSQNSVNLIPNPGLEDINGKAGLPKGWAHTTYGNGVEFSYIQDGMLGENVYDGESALCIAKGGNSREGWHIIDKALPEVREESEYKLSLQVRGIHLGSDDRLRLALVWMNDAKQKIASDAGTFSVPSSFEPLGMLATAPNGSRYVRVTIGLLLGKDADIDENTKVYLDHIELVEVD